MSIALSQKELEQMREDVNALLPNICNILSVTRTADGEGGFSEAWGTATRNVSCRMDATVQTRENITDGSLRTFHSYELTFAYDTTITTDNRVELDGTQYHIVSVPPVQDWAIEKTVTIEALS